MTPSRILVVGSGGREHVLAWRLSHDPDPAEILVAPGNDGIGRSFRRIPVEASDTAGLVAACRTERIDLVVVGPEAPLAAGLTDALETARIPVYGPSGKAARLESSKSFAKSIMVEAGVPTARAEVFERVEDAIAALVQAGPPWVLKADGLAAGKGVLVTTDHAAAVRFLRESLSGERFGAAGRRILVEEHLSGEELSVMAVCDGENAELLPAARDYKRALDRDSGPNTGGMGAYAPSDALDQTGEREVRERIVRPVLQAMAARGTPYRGTLYCGLIRTPDGLRVIEFNCRFGDPETEAILPLVEGSLTALLASAVAGRVDERAVRHGAGAVVAAALVDDAYPENARGGGEITGLDALEGAGDLWVFHAGLGLESGRWRVRGGRAAFVTARAETRRLARERVYAGIAMLGGHGWRHRTDIGAAADSGPRAIGAASGGAHAA